MTRVLTMFRRFWTFVVVERLGYRRPSPLSEWDYEMRNEAERRVRHLEEATLALLDERADLFAKYGRRRGDHR